MSTETNTPAVEPGTRRDWACWCSLMMMILFKFLTMVLLGLVIFTRRHGM